MGELGGVGAHQRKAQGNMIRQQRRLLKLIGSHHGGAACVARFSFLLLALTMAGCTATMTDPPGGFHPTNTAAPAGQESQADQAVTPVVLRNPVPGVLDVSLVVTFDQESGDTQPMIEVGLAFLSNGHTVQFAGDERVTCDGNDLSLKNRDAVFQVLRAPTAQVAGASIQCTYSADGATASVSLVIPAVPAIISLQAGAQVVRSARTLVTYHYDPATETMLGIVALAPSSPSPKALARMNTPGPLQATVDTSGFAPGPGTLILTASLNPHFSESGASFKSVIAFGTATTPVAVMWL